ncbi:MAG: hypothetical protein NTV44_02985 [Firmicutes bacterium]|nr:hypothetical protein [Bacillota bacterium]
MNTEQPRILVISNNAISNENANGKTLKTLLGQFQKDNVAQIYIRPEIPDITVAGNFFRMTDLDKLKSLFGRKKSLGNRITPDSMPKGTNTQFSSKSEKKLFSSHVFIESGFARYIRERVWKNKRGSFENLHQFVEEFKPTVILLYASRSAFMLDMAYDLSIKYKIPLMIYTSEDEYFHQVPWYQFFSRKCLSILKKAYTKCIAIASSVITNHTQLSEVIEKEFRVPSKVIYSSSSVVSSAQPIDVVTPYFLYAGNVTSALHRCESLLQIADALGNIDPEYRLHVFATNASKKTTLQLKKNAYVILHEPVGADALADIVSHATIVFHTESFKRSVKGLIQNSFSSKIPDLLGSGRPIIFYAPEYCAFYPYLRKEGVGALASSKDQLQKEIRSILGSEDYRNKIICSTLELFAKNHQQQNNSNSFLHEAEKASQTMRNYPQDRTSVRNLRLNRWLVPILFVYFVLSLFPTMIPYISFLPNIFASSLIELAWKGLLFVGLSGYFLLLIIHNHIRFNWILTIFIGIYAFSNLIVIALIPASTMLSSVNTGTLLEYEVVISTTTKVAGVFQVLSTVVLTYIFMILMPKIFLFKKQLFLLLYLILGFLVLCGIYSIIFEKDTIIGLFSPFCLRRQKHLWQIFTWRNHDFVLSCLSIKGEVAIQYHGILIYVLDHDIIKNADYGGRRILYHDFSLLCFC